MGEANNNIKNTEYVVSAEISSWDKVLDKSYKLGGIEYLLDTDLSISSNEDIGYNRFELLKSKVLALKKLQFNWNGYGAYPIDNDIILNTLSFITLLSDNFIDGVTDLMPNPNGTITIEWEYLESLMSLEIGKSNYSYFVRFKHKDPILRNGKDLLQDIKIFTSNLNELYS